ncbi:MAG: DUF1707 SHOCT-like domain-containing protein [Arachnia sp.]
MTNTPHANPWQGFTRDPRSREASELRASDADRDHAATILADAYADGRLRNSEYSERMEVAMQTTHLRQFVPLISDLTLPTPLVIPEPPRHVIPWHRTPAFHAASAAAGILIGFGVLVLFLSGGGGALWWMIWPFMIFVLPQLIGLVKSGIERTLGPGGTNELPKPNKDDNSS